MIRFAISYLKQRMWNLPLLALLLSVAILSAILHADFHSSIAVTFSVDLLLVSFLVWQFRIWDDLADREYDRRVHPDRLACRPELVRRSVVLLILLAIGNLVAVALVRSTCSVATLVVLDAAIAFWYTFSWRLRYPVMNYHVVLLKYPAILAIVATTKSSPPLVIAPMILVLYLTTCVYEAMHDRRLRVNRMVRWLAWSETAALSLSALAAAAMAHSLPVTIGGD